MKLIGLTLRGFRSFKDELEVVIDPGVLFLLGNNEDDTKRYDSNGGGKTTFIASIPWALYGELPTGSKKDHVINWLSDEVFVEVMFEGLLVRRSKQRGMPEQLSFFHADKWEEGDLATMQDRLLQILGISSELFYNTIWVDAKSKSVQFLWAKPAQRLQLLEEILGDEVYGQAKTIATRKKAAFEKEIKDAQIRIEEITKQEEKQRTRLLTAQAGYAQAAAKMSERSRNNLHRKAVLKKQVREATEELTVSREASMSVSEISSRIQDIQDGFQVIRERIATEKATLTDVSNFRHTCPTCKQVIPVEHVTKLRGTNVQAEANIRAMQEAMPAIQERLKYLEELQAEGRVRDESLKSRERERLALVRELERVSADVDEDSGLTEFQGVIEEAKNALIDLQRGRQAHEQDVVQKSKDLPMYRLMEDCFGSRGIRNMLLDDIRNLLAFHVKSYAQKLFGDTLSLSLPTDRDKFEILIQTEHSRGPVDIADLSRGEVWRANLAVLLGLRKVLHHLTASDMSLLFLDDAIGDMDNTGAEVLAAVVEKLGEDFSHVFATFPREVESMPEEMILRINKRRGISTLGEN